MFVESTHDLQNVEKKNSISFLCDVNRLSRLSNSKIQTTLEGNMGSDNSNIKHAS